MDVKSATGGAGGTRRIVLKRAIGFGIGITIAPVLTLAQSDQASIRPKEDDLLVKVGDAELTPLTPGDVPLASAPLAAWAMDPAEKIVRSGSRLNRVILIRLELETISAATRTRAADGVLAFTAICPHSGCDVSDWLPAELLLYCACHSSKFDPKDGARVVDGPAPRSLPALPLKIVDGLLVVARPFTARVGFEEI
jgi:Rieske Fe-S protein